MAPEEASKPVKVSKEAFDVISNRIAVAIARRESLIKSWTAASSSLAQSIETEEEGFEAEALFRDVPPHLGVGAPIPSHYLVSEAERNNKSLRAKFFPSKGLKASKARDAEEKAASAKRGLNHESSDEEEGRSALGRAKKQKTSKTEPAKVAKHIPSLADIDQESRSKVDKAKKPRVASSTEHLVIAKHIKTLTSPDLESTSKLGKAKKQKSKRQNFDEETQPNLEKLKESEPKVRVEPTPIVDHTAPDTNSEEEGQANVGMIKKHKSKKKSVETSPAIGHQGTSKTEQNSSCRDPNVSVVTSTTVPPQTKKVPISIVKDQAPPIPIKTPKSDNNQTLKLVPDLSGAMTGDERRRARKKEKKLLKKLRQAELAANS